MSGGKCLDVSGAALEMGPMSFSTLAEGSPISSGGSASMEVSRVWGSGRCLDVDQANGNVIIWDCHGGSNQQWAFDPVDQKPRPNPSQLVFIQNGQDVLDVEGATNVDGANIISYAKNHGWNQKWSLVRYSISNGRVIYLIRNERGKCLDVGGANTGNGSNVILYTCRGEPNQLWWVHSDGSIQGFG